MTIRNKILFWLLIPSILIVIITASFCYFYIQKTVEQNIFGQLEIVADKLKEHVQVFLEGKRGRTIDFSSDGFIRNCTKEITMKESMREHYISALNDHLIINKKSLAPSILEVFVVDFKGKVIASTDEDRIGRDVSSERYFSEAGISRAFVSGPQYDPRLEGIVIYFSAVLSSKSAHVPVGIIVNRIKSRHEVGRKRSGISVQQDYEQNYSELVAVNKARIVDFSSDAFIRDCTEEITGRDERVFYYADLLNEHLAVNKQPLDPYILAVFVVDLDGKVVGSTEIGQVGRDVSGETFFSKTMKRGSYISDLKYSTESKQNTFFDITRLLLSRDGLHTIGIIVNRYNGDSLRRITHSGITGEFKQVKQLKELGNIGEVYIVNRDKLMITESRFIEDAIFNQVVDTEGVQAAFDNGAGKISIYPNYRGISVLGVSRYIEDMGWVVLAEKDVSEAFTPLTRLRNFAIITGVTCIVIIVTVAIFFARGITRPITKLVTSTQAIAKGDLAEQIEVKSNDEVGYLATSFDIMRTRLGELLEKNEKAKRDWESTFDSVKDMIILYDKDCKITRYNDELLSRLNVKPKDIIGKKCYEVFYVDEKERNKHKSECKVTLAAKTKKSSSIEKESTSLRGTFLFSTFPRFGDKGEFTGVVQILRDITDLKRTEEKMREISNFNQSLISALPFGMDIVDEEGNILYMSEIFTKLFGNGALGQKCWSLYRDNKKQCDRCPLKKDFYEDNLKIIETEDVLDGNTFQITHVGIIYKGKKAILEIFNDITDLKHVEEELRKSHMEVEQLLTAIPSIMISVDHEGRIIWWNNVAEKTFGIAAADVIGRPFRECGIKWDWDEVVKQVSMCQRKKYSKRLDDFQYTRLDGSNGLLGFTLNSVSGGINEKSDVLLLGSDITKRRDMEEQLAQSQKLEAIGQLAVGIAHEINTPTQFISNNTFFLQDAFSKIRTLLKKYLHLLEMMKASSVTPELINDVDDMVRDIKVEYLVKEIPIAIKESQDGLSRVTEIVQAMKTFSHPDDKEKVPVDINNLIESTITVSKNEWKYVADTETDFDSDLPPVPCYPGEFNQVILNLIINAAHAIEEAANNGGGGNGIIRVSTRYDGDWAEIRISDTGTGIPEKNRSRIFEPFFTTKEVGKGTGQGLSIAHSVVVKRHNGEITLDTEIGKGTTFIIRLPIGNYQVEGREERERIKSR